MATQCAREARYSGALTVEVNREQSEVSGLFVQQRRGDATSEVVLLVEELLADCATHNQPLKTD